jgi:hypothetical protein
VDRRREVEGWIRQGGSGMKKPGPLGLSFLLFTSELKQP